MRRRMVGLLLLTTLVGCSGALSGKYLTSPGSGYGFEFRGDTVYSLVGGKIGRGTYSVDGATVRVCFGVLCTDLRRDGDCLVQHDGARYCAY